jgi:hypothetical protein
MRRQTRSEVDEAQINESLALVADDQTAEGVKLGTEPLH